MITGHQPRDARRLIGWTVLALARVLHVERLTLSDSDAQALVRTFEAAGIEFTAEDPPGARLQKRLVMEDDMNMPELGETWQDNGMSAVKGIIGTIPLVGSILGELISVIVPNQRIQRLEAYIERLNSRFSDMHNRISQINLNEPDRVDLFEEGAFQTIRALSQERKNSIANLVINGMSGEQKEVLNSKRLLRILSQIDDGEIILLKSYSRMTLEDHIKFLEQHDDILGRTIITEGSPQQDIDKEALRQFSALELSRLGLLKIIFPS